MSWREYTEPTGDTREIMAIELYPNDWLMMIEGRVNRVSIVREYAVHEQVLVEWSKGPDPGWTEYSGCLKFGAGEFVQIKRH